MLYAFGDAVAKGPEFLLLPIYAASLGPSDYGILGIATVVTLILRPTLSFGLQAAALKFYYDAVDDINRRRFYGGLWLFYLVGSGVLYLVLDSLGSELFGSLFSQVAYSPYIRIAIWTAFISSAFLEIPKQLFRASGRAGRYAILNIAQFASTTTFTIALVVVRQDGALGALQANLLGTSVIALGCAVFMARFVRFPKDLRIIWHAIVYSLPMVPHFLAHWVLSSSDRVILERYVPLDELGLYTLGYTVGWSLSIIKTATMNSLVPLYGSLDAGSIDERRQVASITTYYIAAMAYVGMLLVVFGPELISLVAPDQYAGAVVVVPWAVLGAFCLSLYTPSVQVLSLVLGQTRMIGIATLIAALTNVVLNLLIIPTHGIVGAAVTTAISYALLALGMFAIAQRRFTIPYEYGRIMLLLGSILLPAAAVAVFAGTGTWLWIGVKITAAILPVVVLKVGGFFHERELRILRGTIGIMSRKKVARG